MNYIEVYDVWPQHQPNSLKLRFCLAHNAIGHFLHKQSLPKTYVLPQYAQIYAMKSCLCLSKRCYSDMENSEKQNANVIVTRLFRNDALSYYAYF